MYGKFFGYFFSDFFFYSALEGRAAAGVLVVGAEGSVNSEFNRKQTNTI